MFRSRPGSLNELEEFRLSRFWKRWVGRSPASADIHGLVYAGSAPHHLRQGLHYVCSPVGNGLTVRMAAWARYLPLRRTLYQF